MKKYDLILLGATFLSLGIADVYTGKTLIIDSKTKPGYEYIDAFHNFSLNNTRLNTQKGVDFAEYLNSFDLYSNVYIPEWTAYVSKWIYEKSMSILLLTDVLEVQKLDNRLFKVIIFNSNGRQELYTKQIVDTRTKSPNKKYLNALVCGGNVDSFDSAMSVVNCCDISIIEVEIPIDYTYTRARERVVNLWQSRPAKYDMVKLAAIADVFYEEVNVDAVEVTAGYKEVYSTYYSNPLTAFDKGCKIGGELNDKLCAEGR